MNLSDISSATTALVLSCALLPMAASAQTGPTIEAAATARASAIPSGPTPAQARAGYALPWTMRPAIAPTLARIESSVGIRNDGVAAATLFTAGEAIVPATVGYYVRFGMTNSSLTSTNAEVNNATATAISNPLLMLLYTPELIKGLRLSVLAACTLPVGTGGGNMPSALPASSIATGIPTRSAMDNALFAVNYATPILGLGLALIKWKFTFQAEATVLQLIRVHGESTRAASDAMRTNFTSGLSVGYLVHPLLTASAELHYQHWLSAPNLLSPPNGVAPPPNQLSFEVGVRTNIALSRTILARPGLSFGMGIGGAMADRDYKVIHIDFPITF